MASNRFGTHFCMTSWGESHGPAIGAVIDGCPAGIEVTEDDLNGELEKRAPGRSPYTSPRKEPDKAEILSGLFEGKTTGAPISIVIWNRDAKTEHYEPIKSKLRPGHANATYLAKYGVFDWRGGGRASARETACRVAAGAIAEKLLAARGVTTRAWVEHGKLVEGDSIGGVVHFCADGVPRGLGDPIYNKLEAELAHAMLSIPASKGFEIGSGFAAAAMRGSEHNDAFVEGADGWTCSTNHAGGVLGGISTGLPLEGRVAFKPTSSIAKPQATVDLDGNACQFVLPSGSRHDPCVAIRAVAVVQAMLRLVLVDRLLASGQFSQLQYADSSLL